MMKLRLPLTSITKNTVRRKHKEVNVCEMRSSMDEKLYKKIKSIGAGNIVFGIISVVCGVTTGVLLIVNGARLLAHKSDTLF